MTIKEVAEKTGVSADTLRYYERIGLLPAVPRKPNGIRDYDEFFIDWIAFIQDLKSVGMSLEAILDYISLAKLGEVSRKERKQLLVEVQHILLNKIKVLHTMVEKNNYHLEHYDDVLLPKTNKLMYRFK
ncbi:MerR family transcriptional regulator [Megamonas hypermegale]|uniref:MerR family transcriptional regulator n=1 Tax=Megamonas hypermegale TaxID=158847 RepID=UPI0025A3EEB1|nr:MerR family transcriptional regulator [Megamonas hypermegale]MDM8142352.1 MerR family transcriptional regulator [Megamonas hypermegale]